MEYDLFCVSTFCMKSYPGIKSIKNGVPRDLNELCRLTYHCNTWSDLCQYDLYFISRILVKLVKVDIYIYN
jgi:hypothetical protein